MRNRKLIDLNMVVCVHIITPVCDRCTMLEIGDIGLSVIQQRYDTLV